MKQNSIDNMAEYSYNKSVEYIHRSLSMMTPLELTWKGY